MRIIGDFESLIKKSLTEYTDLVQDQKTFKKFKLSVEDP
jgi:hypothetical protein